MNKLPIRKRLPHDVPLWIDPAKECYFITICCKMRGRNQLALPDVANALLETVQHRNDIGVWYVHVAMLMPDHLHMLASFPETGKRVKTIVSKWKEWTAKTNGISWHRDFFEHRLRGMKAFSKKRITFSRIQCEQGWSRKQKTGLTYLLQIHGRDGALRRPRTASGATTRPWLADAAARRPYQSGYFPSSSASAPAS